MSDGQGLRAIGYQTWLCKVNILDGEQYSPILCPEAADVMELMPYCLLCVLGTIFSTVC